MIIKLQIVQLDNGKCVDADISIQFYFRSIMSIYPMLIYIYYYTFTVSLSFTCDSLLLLKDKLLSLLPFEQLFSRRSSVDPGDICTLANSLVKVSVSLL